MRIIPELPFIKQKFYYKFEGKYYCYVDNISAENNESVSSDILELSEEEVKNLKQYNNSNTIGYLDNYTL